jgi:enoyl-CoA hydratase/carnithine racemase
MSFDALLYEVENNILTITLNRPDKLNAFNFEMQNDLIKAFDEADKDDNVKAIIVTGAGRGFCAGADLSAGAKTFDFESRADRKDKRGAVSDDGSVDWSNPSIRDGGGLVTLRIFDCLKPVISACNGPAVGVGITMQLAMDIRLASEDARYGFVFARRGLVPEACSSWFLPKIVGISQALEWVYSGKVFSADEALKGGLIRSIHKPEDLLDEARSIAEEISSNCAPVSIALSRQMLWKMAGANHPMEAHKIDSRGIFARGRMQDAKEGVTSFLEKRNPEFTDGMKDIPDYYPWWEDKDYS